MYCIGKATRSYGKLTKPPYIGKPETTYDLLRMAIYPTKELAELACKLAEKYNPVGFVVIELEAAE